MDTICDLKQGRSEGFITTFLVTVTMLAALMATLLLAALSGSATADSRMTPVGTVLSQDHTTSHADGAEYDQLVLFSAPSLNGPLSAPSLNGPLSAPSLNGPLSAPSLNGPLSAPSLNGPLK